MAKKKTETGGNFGTYFVVGMAMALGSGAAFLVMRALRQGAEKLTGGKAPLLNGGAPSLGAGQNGAAAPFGASTNQLRF
jgi:hypothetical protein